jgi:hypothetical protein
MLRRWIDGEYDPPAPGCRPPQVAKVMAVFFVALALVAAAVFWSPQSWLTWTLSTTGSLNALAPRLASIRAWSWLPLAILPGVAASLWMTHLWHRRPAWRARSFAAVWLGMILVWLAIFELEDKIRIPNGNPQLMAAITRASGVSHPNLFTFGFRDESLSFYARRVVPRLRPSELLSAPFAADGRDFVIANQDDWHLLAQRLPDVAANFVPLLEWRGGARVERVIVLRPKANRTSPTGLAS